MARKIFVNLPVDDLQKSIDFWTRLGFEFNPQFTNDKAACMVIADDNSVMLLTRDFFKTFTKKEIADARTQTEVITALSADSKEAVDELADQALAAGGQPANEPMEDGPMYGRSFQDLDGHLWEVIWMDPSALQQ